MKYYGYVAAAVAFAMLLVFLACAFSLWQIDPGAWGGDMRDLCLGIMLVVAVLTTMFGVAIVDDMSKRRRF